MDGRGFVVAEVFKGNHPTEKDENPTARKEGGVQFGRETALGEVLHGGRGVFASNANVVKLVPETKG